MHQFEKLKIWQKSMDIAVYVYEISALLPNDEKFNLIHQIKKCAVSIPSNIAEGCGRKSDKELKQFVSISLGSSFELETQIIIAKEVDLITIEQFDSINSKLLEIQKMLNGLSKSLDN